MRILMIAACACLLAACSSNNATTASMATTSTTSSSGSSWFWPFGGDEGDAPAADMPQLGVNSYLWRATLDTLNFMPLASADPVGGVVISDWYAAPDKPDEHVKVTVYILDRRLRADAVKVSVFRQVRSANGWNDTAVNADTGIKLENAILARARELRLSTTPQ
jgi:ABC-type oligopeptide transport system substrate-binding subunit